MSENHDTDVPSPSGSRQLQLIVLLASAGDLESAVAEARKLEDSDVAGRAWQVLSEINANLQRWDDATKAIEIALQHDPTSRPLRLSRALLLEQQGSERAALEELESLARESRDSPRLLVNLAAQLAYAGRRDEARAELVAALERWPTDASLHSELARLQWQEGAGLDALHPLEQAIERYPDAMHLRFVAANLLRNADAEPRALELLGEGLRRAPDSAAFHTSIGVLLEGMDRLDEALPHLREARMRAPRSVVAQRNLVPALLRTGAAVEALELCDQLLSGLPDDQMLIAQRAAALRLLGEPEYRKLYDYERLVKVFALRPAAPFANIGEFNASFAVELGKLHRAGQHPLEQSLRGGSQTERSLPRDNPLVAAFFAMLDAPIRAYIGALRAGDPAHPVDRRARGDYRISGSWSVQLRPGGFHLDHVHPRGWLSSAYYVSLPEMSDGATRAGWLKFGEPGLKLAGCPAEHFVKPEAGNLVLFPSYMWHGTVAFAAGAPRLTAAFDVVPA